MASLKVYSDSEQFSSESIPIDGEELDVGSVVANVSETNEDYDIKPVYSLPQEALSAEEKKPVLGANARMLVVDDVAMNRKMIVRTVVERWRDVSEAEDDVLAVDAVKDAQGQGVPFDLVLMDYQMPNMNGPEAARIMRASGYAGFIIGVTGNALPADIALFLEQGANHVLIKPLRLPRLEGA